MTETRGYPFAVDANVVLGLVTSPVGRDLLAMPLFELSMAAHAFDEFREHLERPLLRRVAKGYASREQIDTQYAEGVLLVTELIEIVPQEDYAAFEAEARDRVPGDPDDWHTVALALAFDTEIWTNDRHFLGCGVPTWTNETLRRRLDAGRMP